MRRRRIIFRFSCVVLFRILCEEEGGALMQLEWRFLLQWSSLGECVTYEVMRKKEKDDAL